MAIYLIGESTHDWPPYLDCHSRYPQYSCRFPSTAHLNDFSPLNSLEFINAPQKRYPTKYRRSADVTSCPRRSGLIQVHSRNGFNQEVAGADAAPNNANVSGPPREHTMDRRSRNDPTFNIPSDESSVVEYVPRHLEVDCSEFRPENVQVKVIENCLVVEAHQEEQSDSGFVRMELVRQFELGDRFDLSNIKCLYTTQGRLRIEVPCAAVPEPVTRQVAIVTETAAVQPESSTNLSSEINHPELQREESSAPEGAVNGDVQTETTAESVSSEKPLEKREEQTISQAQEQTHLPAESVPISSETLTA